ncbi:phage distal tail protein, Rcc01695 family [Maritalea sp. S77]|uniref:phage distal tail protein, Rcc01695 family n=1 Tax=Maritalea sp. S77 TaxID=3415125 RepID=UPI003C7E04EB
MAFHHIRFPINIAMGARGGPQWSTDIVSLVSGAEERNTRWAQSRRKYNAGYGVKSSADMRQILSFFEERRGRFHGFLFRDPLDHSSNQESITPYDQDLGFGDGNQTDIQLIKHYGSAFDPYARQIKKPIADSVRVAVNGSELTAGADFTVDETTGILSFASAPTSGANLTAGFEFDVPVRFDTDHLDVELSSFDAGLIPSIPLIEILT